jgi:hypothetical protein
MAIHSSHPRIFFSAFLPSGSQLIPSCYMNHIQSGTTTFFTSTVPTSSNSNPSREPPYITTPRPSARL